MLSRTPLLANLLLAPIVGESDISLWPTQLTPSGSYLKDPTINLEAPFLSNLAFQEVKE